MNDHKFKLLALAVIGVIGISIALVAPNPSIAAPPGNPPSANVSPNFADMNLSGNLYVGGSSDFRGEIKNNRTCSVWDFNCYTHVYINDRLVLGDTSGWNLIFEGVEFGVNVDNKLVINADVEIQGKLKTDQLGRIYQVSDDRTVYNNTANNEDVLCDPGDWVLSCSGGFDPNASSSNTTEIGLIGTEFTSSGSQQGCIAAAWNKSGSSKTMYVHASCIETDNNWGG